MVKSEKLCAMCEAPSKYCCPACSVRTCSLACVNAHKVEKGCTGIRDKTAFVEVKKFSNENLLSDYRFLEDAARAADSAGRALPTNRTPYFLPVHLYKLRKASRARNTYLQFLPAVFTKRKRNTSYLKYSDQVIFWKVEWHFPQIGVSYVDSRLDERTMLNSCLDKYLSLELSSLEVQKDLAYFQTLGHKGVSVLMQKAQSPANDIRYYELKKVQSLKKNFSGKVIIENPTLIVIGNEHISYFPLVTLDTEDSTSVNDVKTFQNSVVTPEEIPVTGEKH